MVEERELSARIAAFHFNLRVEEYVAYGKEGLASHWSKFWDRARSGKGTIKNGIQSHCGKQDARPA